MCGRPYDFTTKKAPGITGADVIVKSWFIHRTRVYQLSDICGKTILNANCLQIIDKVDL